MLMMRLLLRLPLDEVDDHKSDESDYYSDFEDD